MQISFLGLIPVGIGRTGVQFGLLTFSTDVVVEYYLNKYTDIGTIQRETREIQQSHGGLTFTNLGLDFVREKMFILQNGGRQGAKYVIIVLTDGESTIKFATIEAAEKVHEANITVFAVGITSNVDETELRLIATDANEVLLVDNFTALHGIKEQLQEVTCDGKAQICIISGKIILSIKENKADRFKIYIYVYIHIRENKINCPSHFENLALLCHI